MPDQRLNYISGEWCESHTGETFETTDPAIPGDVVATYPESDAEDTERAINAAREASGEWGTTPGPERGRILARTGSLLEERKDELTELLVREEGKTRSEAGGEVQRAIDIFRYYGSKASDIGGTIKSPSARDTKLYTKTEPLGVAG